MIKPQLKTELWPFASCNLGSWRAATRTLIRALIRALIRTLIRALIRALICTLICALIRALIRALIAIFSCAFVPRATSAVSCLQPLPAVPLGR
jgi:hypothetical protein